MSTSSWLKPSRRKVRAAVVVFFLAYSINVYYGLTVNLGEFSQTSATYWIMSLLFLATNPQYLVISVLETGDFITSLIYFLGGAVWWYALGCVLARIFTSLRHSRLR